MSTAGELRFRCDVLADKVRLAAAGYERLWREAVVIACDLAAEHVDRCSGRRRGHPGGGRAARRRGKRYVAKYLRRTDGNRSPGAR